MKTPPTEPRILDQNSYRTVWVRHQHSHLYGMVPHFICTPVGEEPAKDRTWSPSRRQALLVWKVEHPPKNPKGGRPAGRRPGALTTALTIRLTPEEHAQAMAAGGPRWVRAVLRAELQKGTQNE